MIFSTPTLEAEDRDVLEVIHQQREILRYSVAQSPNRWTGFLRRNTFARALQGSNSIEGINAALSDAVAIIDDEKPETVEEETYRALMGYRNALTYVLQTHDDPYFELNAQVIKGLHFMMLSYDLTKLPGQWRSTSIVVVRDPGGETVYEGPDASLVPVLMDELVKSLLPDRTVDSIVRGAMAHLNLTLIHPFKDGNGRMARALQTLVMARDGVLSPVFCSVEEWLGRNTHAYYDILAEVGQGKWHPERNALPWIKFCLRAHFQQAATLIQRNRALSRAFEEISKIIAAHGLHQRVEMTLVDATFGYKVRSGRYQEENSVSDVVASRDLRRLCELDLLEPVGEKRGRYYVASQILKDIYAKARRDDVRAADPYEIVRARAPKHQLNLPGVK
ncbi:MAG: Fic family protein [Alphaproteobacteria bacterium]|nr:Fic family protein [Alphaproteobacteria bacterium]MDE2493657.1 Fic family protein [Alphaproteobacteria bacterium]